MVDSAQYRVRVAATWPLAGDPEYDTPALMVSYRGRAVLEVTDAVAPFAWQEVELTEVARGENSLYVEANWQDVPDDARTVVPSEFAALRVQVLRNDDLIAEQAFWRNDHSNASSGIIQFHSPFDQTSDSADHRSHEGADHD